MNIRVQSDRVSGNFLQVELINIADVCFKYVIEYFVVNPFLNCRVWKKSFNILCPASQCQIL